MSKLLKIIIPIIIVFIISLAGIFLVNNNKHKKEIEPIITEQETALHQSLVDVLSKYTNNYHVQEFSTTERGSNNSNSPLLVTHYSIKIGDKNFSDDISIDWSNTHHNVDDVFTENNKKNLQYMLTYATEIKQNELWSDLEQKMASMSIELVKSNLTYPNNSDFGSSSLEKVSDNEDGSGYYQFKGNVTTINSFGAKINYNYVVSMNISKDLKQYEILDFNIF